jgi:SAM-dependent methyltransferase
MESHWPVRLFKKSILKQAKLSKIVKVLGPIENRNCLDIGSDNGIFSYFFRQMGGTWTSADLDERSVEAIRELVKSNAYQISDRELPFEENEFDSVIIVDFLEHIPDDLGFLDEVYRVLKPGGKLIVNVPNIKTGFLMKFRATIGLTDEEHGHLRPGYSLESLQHILGERFNLEFHTTYTKFFSKFTDTLIVFCLSLIKRKKAEKRTGRGVLVTGQDLSEYNKLFRIYSVIYPIVWAISQLDRLLFFRSGYMLIASAHSNKTIEFVDENHLLNIQTTLQKETSK